MAKPIDDTPHAATQSISCNEFRNSRDYATFRIHGTHDWLLIATVGGQGALGFVDGRRRVVQAGDVTLYRPRSYHDYSTEKSCGWWHIRWAHFMPKPDWLRWLDWPEIAPGTLRLKLPASAREVCFNALERMVISARLPGESRDDLALNALEEALIHAHAVMRQDASTRVDARVQRAMRYLAMHVPEAFAMEPLARHAGLSGSRLTHLFTEELGQSPQQFAEGLKMDSARRLLRQTQLPISQVAAEVGYTDAFYFSRRYRKHHGCAPRDDRSESLD